jgi:integrase
MGETAECWRCRGRGEVERLGTMDYRSPLIATLELIVVFVLGSCLVAIGLVTLRWDQIDLAQGLVHVARLKNGMASVHPLRGPELRALRRLQREDASTAYVFVSERKAPLTPHAVQRSWPAPDGRRASSFRSTRTSCVMRRRP